MEDADVLIDAINTLLSFLPEAWKPRVQAVLALLSAGSAALAIWRPFIAYVAPKLAGSAPYVMIDRALDYVVMNSRRVEVRSKVVKARMSSAPPPPKRKVPPLPGFILLLAFASLIGCAHVPTEDAFRTSLSAFAAVADPAYSLVMDACTTAERALIERVKAEGYKPAYSATFEDISQRCQEAKEVFEAVRSAHDKAASFVESGKLAKLLKGGAP